MTFILKHKDDLIYLLLLLMSVYLGGQYRKIDSIPVKKWFGTILGLALIFIISGLNAIHILLTIAIGIVTIKCSPKSCCHVAAFFVSFGYLFFFRCADEFGLSKLTGQTNLIEMILVLRISGAGFEINGSWLSTCKAKKNDDRKKPEGRDDDYVEPIDPSMLDLAHYCFNYIGLLTGPYYRYRTFDDFFHLPFSELADCEAATLRALKCVPLYVSLYLAISTIWPLNYVETEEFASASFFYRAMYPWALFAQFRMRIYSGMTLAECVCTAAGMGAYPIAGQNRTGHGPTANYLKLKSMSKEEATTAEYDFNTVVSVEAYASEVTPLFRDSMKVWNKAVQYWVGMYVYKRFPVKFLRMHAALFVSVIWHGFHAGYFFCIFFSPFYVMAEDIYAKHFYHDSTGTKRAILSFVFWFLRVHYQSYQTAAFLLLTFDRCWKFYTLMNHYLYYTWALAFIIGLILNHCIKKRTSRTEQTDSSVTQSERH